MTEVIRTYKYRAFRPETGLDAFATAVDLKREMWADLCEMEADIAARRAPLLAVPKAERDGDALAALRQERTDRIRIMRQKYAARGLQWGDYNACVFQFSGAVQASAARGALPRPSDAALGDCVTMQIMNGCAPHELHRRSDVRIEYLPKNETELRRKPGSRRAAYRRARLHFRVRTDRNVLGEAIISVDFVLHRPLPPDARIVEVRLLRSTRPIINAEGVVRHIERWSITFALKIKVSAAQGQKCVGVALDWKSDGDEGTNLATIASASGLRSIGFPAYHLDEWRCLREMRMDAEQESDLAAREALQAEVAIRTRRLSAHRTGELRRMAREIVTGNAAIGIEKINLSGKGVKNWAAPAEFRRELKRAAENAGCKVVEVKLPNGRALSRNRAGELRKAAVSALFAEADEKIMEAAE